MAAAYLYGAFSYRYSWFPTSQLREAKRTIQGLIETWSGNDVLSAAEGSAIEIVDSTRITDNLVLVMGIGPNRRNFVHIINREGQIVHEWMPNWFEIWKDDTQFPLERRPKSQPGAIVHGIALLPSGDIVLNFEHLSTVRLNMCGNLVWKLPNLGHHSVHVAEDGNLWVSAEDYIEENPTGFQNHTAPLQSWTIQKISPDGKILKTVPVIEILKSNGLEGLLHLSSIENGKTEVSGDTLHLNEVETYPSRFSSDIFAPGDLLLSLRNINTILVIDPNTYKIKYRETGAFLRQHDPDFIGGNLISVFDNRNLRPSRKPEKPASRIVVIDAAKQNASVALSGAGEHTFFTSIMGEHQNLPNGNILVTSTTEGRVMEYAADGSLLWSFQNRVDDEWNGHVTMGMLLPDKYDKNFFTERARACAAE
ncbi:arylsulfotransferase family protein [Roseovarius litorisediminis]|nr:arylsulfotransferase family protein [Roseovarius litorisediminis]